MSRPPSIPSAGALKAFGKQARNISCSLISREWAGAPSPSASWPLLSAPVRSMSYGPRLGHPALGGPVPLFTRNNHIQIAPLTTYTYSSPPAHGTGSTQQGLPRNQEGNVGSQVSPLGWCWYTAAILVFLLIYHDIEMTTTESQHRDHLDGQLSRLIWCNFFELERLNV